MNVQLAQAQMQRDLRQKSLSRRWAKLEILLGLFAAACGLLYGEWTIVKAIGDPPLPQLSASIGLFVLGGYLAMAGHRSHLYQSSNQLVAYLLSRLCDDNAISADKD